MGIFNICTLADAKFKKFVVNIQKGSSVTLYISDVSFRGFLFQAVIFCISLSFSYDTSRPRSSSPLFVVLTMNSRIHYVYSSLFLY